MKRIFILFLFFVTGLACNTQGPVSIEGPSGEKQNIESPDDLSPDAVQGIEAGSPAAFQGAVSTASKNMGRTYTISIDNEEQATVITEDRSVIQIGVRTFTHIVAFERIDNTIRLNEFDLNLNPSIQVRIEILLSQENTIEKVVIFENDQEIESQFFPLDNQFSLTEKNTLPACELLAGCKNASTQSCQEDLMKAKELYILPGNLSHLSTQELILFETRQLLNYNHSALDSCLLKLSEIQENFSCPVNSDQKTQAEIFKEVLIGSPCLTPFLGQ